MSDASFCTTVVHFCDLTDQNNRNYYSPIQIVQNAEPEVEVMHSALSELKIHAIEKCINRSKRVSAMYEVEHQICPAFIFKFFCLFEDLQILQQELRRIWESYKSDEIDLVTASLITTATIDLVEHLDQDLYWTTPELHQSERSWSSLLDHITESIPNRAGHSQTAGTTAADNDLLANINESIDRFQDSDAQTDLRLFSTLEEFLYVPTYETLKFVAERSDRRSDCPLVIMLSLRALLPGWPVNCDSMRTQKFEKEHELLCQLIQDLSLKNHLDKQVEDDYVSRSDGSKLTHSARSDEQRLEYICDAPRAPYEDIFAASMRKVWQDGVVQLQSVFAARVQLDMIQISATKLKGQEHMEEVADLNARRVKPHSSPFDYLYFAKDDHSGPG